MNYLTKGLLSRTLGSHASSSQSVFRPVFTRTRSGLTRCHRWRSEETGNGNLSLIQWFPTYEELVLTVSHNKNHRSSWTINITNEFQDTEMSFPNLWVIWTWKKNVKNLLTVPSQSSWNFFTSYWNGVKNGKLKSVYFLMAEAIIFL